MNEWNEADAPRFSFVPNRYLWLIVIWCVKFNSILSSPSSTSTSFHSFVSSCCSPSPWTLTHKCLNGFAIQQSQLQSAVDVNNKKSVWLASLITTAGNAFGKNHNSIHIESLTAGCGHWQHSVPPQHADIIYNPHLLWFRSIKYGGSGK